MSPSVLTTLLNAVALLAWLPFAYALWRYPQIFHAFTDSKALLLPAYVALISGPAWYGYGRLSTFDKLDGLTASRRALVNDFCLGMRSVLLKAFLVPGALAIAVLITFLAVQPQLANTDYLQDITSVTSMGVGVAAVIVAGWLCVFVRSLVKVVAILRSIEVNRNKVAEWQQQEIARRKLADQLRKFRTDQPLIFTDDQLRQFREIANFDAMEAPVEAPEAAPAPAVPLQAENEIPPIKGGH